MQIGGLTGIKPVRLPSTVIARESLKRKRRHSTLRERGAGGDDVGGDVRDDAVSVGVADWLLAELRGGGGGVVSNGEEGVAYVYEVVVWT